MVEKIPWPSGWEKTAIMAMITWWNGRLINYVSPKMPIATYNPSHASRVGIIEFQCNIWPRGPHTNQEDFDNAVSYTVIHIFVTNSWIRILFHQTFGDVLDKSFTLRIGGAAKKKKWNLHDDEYSVLWKEAANFAHAWICRRIKYMRVYETVMESTELWQPAHANHSTKHGWRKDRLHPIETFFRMTN